MWYLLWWKMKIWQPWNFVVRHLASLKKNCLCFGQDSRTRTMPIFTMISEGWVGRCHLIEEFWLMSTYWWWVNHPNTYISVSFCIVSLVQVQLNVQCSMFEQKILLLCCFWFFFVFGKSFTSALWTCFEWEICGTKLKIYVFLDIEMTEIGDDQ
jgi:hypothetical protein